MHFYERMKQKFVYIYLFVLARRFYRFLKNLSNVGYDILERGYRFSILHEKLGEKKSLQDGCRVCSQRRINTIVWSILRLPFYRNPDEFLRRYITVDETWIHHYTPGRNSQNSGFLKGMDSEEGISAPVYATVYIWVNEFKRARTSTKNEYHSGRPVEVTTPEMIGKTHDMVLSDRRMKEREIVEATGISHDAVF